LWHLTDKPPAPGFVAYWTNNGQKAALGLDLSAAIDPSATSAAVYYGLIAIFTGFFARLENPSQRSSGANVNDTLLWALVAAALLLNGLVKIDTADGEELRCNFQILQRFIFRIANIDGHWTSHVPIAAFVFREGIARNCVGRPH
jgi:hypothetical protein